MELSSGAPPPPSRDRRKSLLPPIIHQEISEEIPTIVENGILIEKQTVAPDHYRWYIARADGGPDDIFVFNATRNVHGGTTAIFVNKPGKDYFPTSEDHDWNPTKGFLEGPVGEYRIAVYCVPSLVEDEDHNLVTSSVLAVFDLSIEWTALDENSWKVREQYSRSSSASVWDSSYGKEVAGKYENLQKEFEQEQAEMEAKNETEFKLDSTPFPKSFAIGPVLGRGVFSCVFKVKNNSTGKESALKVLDKKLGQSFGFTEETMNRQVPLLKSLSQKSIIQLEDVYQDENYLILLQEVAQGDLLHVLSKTTPYDEGVVRGIITQLLETLSVLHSQHIVHSSISPENLYLNGNALKVGGFTSAFKVEKEKNLLSGASPLFQAPEILNGEGFSIEADMWALGVISYLLLAGSLPFKDPNNIRLNQKIRQGKFEFQKEEWASLSQAQEFVSALLKVDPTQRLSAEKALQHPWIKASGGAALSSVPAKLLSAQ